MAPVQPVPGLELFDGHLELPRDAVNRIAAANGVHNPAAGGNSLVPIVPRTRLQDQPLACHERVARSHVVHPGEGAHRNVVAARNARESLAGADPINDLADLRPGVGLRPVDPRRRDQHLVGQLTGALRNLERLAGADAVPAQVVDLGEHRRGGAVFARNHGQRFAPLHLVHDVSHAIFRRQGLQAGFVGIGIVDGHQHAMRAGRVGGPAVVSGVERDQFIVGRAGQLGGDLQVDLRVGVDDREIRFVWNGRKFQPVALRLGHQALHGQEFRHVRARLRGEPQMPEIRGPACGAIVRNGAFDPGFADVVGGDRQEPIAVELIVQLLQIVEGRPRRLDDVAAPVVPP